MEALVLFMSLLTVIGIILGVLESLKNKDSFWVFIKNIVFSILFAMFSVTLIALALYFIVMMWTWIFKTLGF